MLTQLDLELFHWCFYNVMTVCDIVEVCWYFVWLLLTAMNISSGAAALCDIANVYETLGKFLSHLNLLPEVKLSFSISCDYIYNQLLRIVCHDFVTQFIFTMKLMTKADLML